jgi:dTDP-4-amino-4,6-dideoxygalactose transaminase
VQIPLFNMQRELAPVRTAVDAAIKRVLDSGVFIGGHEVSQFEHKLAAAVGCQHAIGVSSGTDALLVIAMASGIDRNSNVVTTPLTYGSTATTVARLGARVVFADVDDESLNLDPQSALNACDDRTRAIVVVNLYGQLANLPRTAIDVIEDSAQSLGAGLVRGIAATTSFFPTKNLGGIGDAGAVLCNDDQLAHKVKLLRGHGAAPKYRYVELGGNFRMDALHAAVLDAKLEFLPQWIEARRCNAQRYRSLFASSNVPSEVRLPLDSDNHAYHQFVIRTPRRDALRDYLSSRGIGTEVYYPEPLHVQPCFAHLGYRLGSLPIAERACKEVLALPIAPTTTSDEQAYVVESVADFFA